VPLTIRCNGQELFRATGFFWQWEGGKTFLVSNWHIFAGCHHLTKRSPVEHGSGTPEEIAYPRFINSNDLHEREWDTVLLKDADGVVRWFQHPVHGSAVDLAAIEVPAKTDKGFLQPIEEYSFERKATPRYEMTRQLSIIGFPISRRPFGFFPIWIQATVASEMDIGYDGKRAFLVDALTSSGMSGSPVYSSPIATVNGIIGWTFVGIYSGRIIENEVELPLGVVWNRELIYDTILCKSLGVV
jgi:hypothetical protein